MIRNHKLIIDKNCPLCGIYGNCFTASKLVDKQTIAYYQTVNGKIFDQIDPKRATYEVAFVNPRSGKTIYGVDAFLHILSHKNRFLKWLFQLSLVHFVLVKLYRFISYNRHVIVGRESANDSGRVCEPPVNLFYRVLYILLAAVFTGFMVNQFSVHLDNELAVYHVSWREYAVCFGQIFWQFICLSLIKPRKRLAYLGNMSTVSIIGGILLIPLLVLNVFVDFSWLQLLIGFSLIVGVMLLLHIRRCKRLGLPLLVSLSWIIFRTIVLITVLIFIYF